MLHNGKITMLQAGMLLTLAVGLVNHVILIPLLLGESGKDSWISVLFTIPFGALWIYLLFYLSKHMGPTGLAEWLRLHTNKLVHAAVLALLSGILLLNAAISLKDVIWWTKITYLPKTPILVTAGLFTLLCVYCASKGIRGMAVTAGILLPVVWALGYFVMNANWNMKRYTFLFPLFTSNLHEIGTSMIYTLSTLFELFFLLLFQHHVKSPVKRKHLLLLGLIMLSLTLGPLMGAIAAFGNEAAQLRYPAFEQWRLVTISAYFNRVDFLSIYQWLAGALIRISLYLYLIVDMLPISSHRYRIWGLNGLGILMFAAIVAIPLSDQDFQRILKDYFLLTFSIFCLLTVWLSLIVYFRTRLRGKRT